MKKLLLISNLTIIFIFFFQLVTISQNPSSTHQIYFNNQPTQNQITNLNNYVTTNNISIYVYDINNKIHHNNMNSENEKYIPKYMTFNNQNPFELLTNNKYTGVFLYTKTNNTNLEKDIKAIFNNNVSLHELNIKSNSNTLSLYFLAIITTCLTLLIIINNITKNKIPIISMILNGYPKKEIIKNINPRQKTSFYGLLLIIIMIISPLLGPISNYTLAYIITSILVIISFELIIYLLILFFYHKIILTAGSSFLKKKYKNSKIATSTAILATLTTLLLCINLSILLTTLVSYTSLSNIIKDSNTADKYLISEGSSSTYREITQNVDYDKYIKLLNQQGAISYDNIDNYILANTNYANKYLTNIDYKPTSNDYILVTKENLNKIPNNLKQQNEIIVTQDLIIDRKFTQTNVFDFILISDQMFSSAVYYPYVDQTSILEYQKILTDSGFAANTFNYNITTEEYNELKIKQLLSNIKITLSFVIIYAIGSLISITNYYYMYLTTNSDKLDFQINNGVSYVKRYKKILTFNITISILSAIISYIWLIPITVIFVQSAIIITTLLLIFKLMETKLVLNGFIQRRRKYD